MLAIAVGAVSAAALLVRLAEGVSPVAAAFWRTAAVGLLLSPGIRRVSRRDALLIAAAGLCLGLHFWVWFESLARTSVLRSTVLVCLTPMWAGIIEAVVLRRSPPRRFWAGIAGALVGVASLAGGGGSPGSLVGDGLAVLGGLGAGLYFTTGSRVRQRVGIGAYGSLVSAAAALWLLPIILLLKVPLTGYATLSWVALAGMALGPQLLGHQGFNYAVRFVPASVVGAVILLEPVGAAALAALVLRELPTVRDVAGSALVLAGVGLATTGRR